MSMKIQKGLVKDQGFADTTLTYGTCEDGNIYYFIENGVLSNGNIIASSNLKEAIGHTESHTSLGLINSEGRILIPFENKSIKLINDKYLLVEKTNPSTPSVVAAQKDRMDPLSANRLVTTAANVKNQINSKIGQYGKFIFNNQFSEASVFDYDGNNIMNDYYSYIAIDDDKLYFCKNIMDFPVLNYSLNGEANTEEVYNDDVHTASDSNLDVTNTGVAMNSVENEFNNIKDEIITNEVVSMPESTTVTPDVVSDNTGDVNKTVDTAVSDVEVSDDSVNSNDFVEIPNPDSVVSENNMSVSNNVESEDADKSNNTLDIPKSDTVVNSDIMPVYDEDVSEDEDTSEYDVTKDIDINTEKEDDNILKSREVDENINESSDNQDNMIDEFNFKFDDPDVVIEYANNVMKELINQNKHQKDIITEQDEHIETIEEENKELNAQLEEVSNKNDDLLRKVSRYENIIEKYVKRLNSLTDKVDSQSKTITDLQKRLDVLEPQIAGREKLGSTVEEAMEILNESENLKESFDNKLYFDKY